MQEVKWVLNILIMGERQSLHKYCPFGSKMRPYFTNIWILPPVRAIQVCHLITNWKGKLMRIVAILDWVDEEILAKQHFKILCELVSGLSKLWTLVSRIGLRLDSRAHTAQFFCPDIWTKSELSEKKPEFEQDFKKSTYLQHNLICNKSACSLFNHKGGGPKKTLF